MASSPADRIQPTWITNADGWTRAVREGRIESRRVATDQAIVDAILSVSPRRVVDFGCGEGWLVRALTEQAIDAMGIDSSPPLIEAAAAAGQGTFRVASYREVLADPRELGPDIDAIVFNFALLEEEITDTLRGLQSVLAPGGHLIIQTPHPWTARGDNAYADGWRIEDFRGLNLEAAEPMPWFYRTLESWVSLLGEAGFEIVQLREPLHPESGEPLSLVLIGRPVP